MPARQEARLNRCALAGLDQQIARFLPKGGVLQDFSVRVTSAYSPTSLQVEPRLEFETKALDRRLRLRYLAPVGGGVGQRAQVEYRFSERASLIFKTTQVTRFWDAKRRALVYLVYQIRHWLFYRRYTMTHIKLTGYIGMVTVALCGISGLISSISTRSVYGISASARSTFMWPGMRPATG